MTERNRPPRPGDPDGTLVERLTFWIGFICWYVTLVALYAGYKVYSTMESRFKWLRWRIHPDRSRSLEFIFWPESDRDDGFIAVDINLVYSIGEPAPENRIMAEPLTTEQVDREYIEATSEHTTIPHMVVSFSRPEEIQEG